MDTRPIGLYDSGSGGLSIWQSVISVLPHESTVYLGDHRYLPYSIKTQKFIRERGKRCIRFLLSKNVKLIVVACNTATVAGIDYFRRLFSGVPIVGVVPVVKTAAEKSTARKFGVFSTEFTAKSDYQHTLINTHAKECEVYSVGNTDLVRIIENGEKDSPHVTELLQTLLNPIIKDGIDVLVLGCTHFPFLRPAIRRIVGKNVLVLDSGEAVGRHVKHILEHERLSSSRSGPAYCFYTTGDAKKVSNVAFRLLDRRIVVKTAPHSVQ